jgi:hypothetical protein
VRRARAAKWAAIILSIAFASVQPGVVRGLSPHDLARAWDADHVSPPVPALVAHDAVVAGFDALARAAPGLVRVETIGQSVEGRGIIHVSAGTGAFAVLLWSQMHGDEPTATSALLDVFDFLRRRRDDPAVRRILSSLTLHAVPMLNPDGAERLQRRNAQGIDINRDALRLQTPEGRILKALRDRLQPRIGFNLHNQSWRTSVGDPPRPASISLLAVAYDRARTENAGRRLTKRVCAVIRDAVEPFASGQIGRYDDGFEVRAFGDNITLWGTPVVLIETGAWPSAEPDPMLVRLNFIALLSALDALASGSVERADPGRYESMPLNESKLLHTIVRNATVINGAGVPPFVADIGIGVTRRLRIENGQRRLQLVTTIEDLGDLRTLGALREIDASGMTVVPLGDGSTEVGDLVDLPAWKEKRSAAVAVGEPARIAILKAAVEPGKYQVEAVLK